MAAPPELDPVFAGSGVTDAELAAERRLGVFLAYRAAAGNVSSGDVIDFDAEECDLSDWFDLAANRYVPQVAGYYLLSATVGMTAGQNQRWLWPRLRKNGVVHKTLGLDWASLAGSVMSDGQAIVEANGSTDYFDLRVDHNDTGARPLLAGLEFCRLEGYLIARS